jgi:hypothetical protein
LSQAAKRFSASDAALEGFRVIAARWRLVVGWGLFNLMGLVGASIAAVMLIFIASAVAGSREAATAIGGVIGGVILGLGAFLIQAMIVSALFRAVLREEAPGFLHLRIGGEELRLALVWAVTLVATGAGVTLAWTLAGWAGAAGGAMAGVPVALAVFAILAWLALRVSLAAPVAVAERRMGFAQSWRLTRGRVVGLLGMAVLTFCLLAMLMIVVWLALSLLSGAATGFDDLGLLLRTDAQALADRPGFYLVALAVQFLLAPILWIISQAPLAAAYKAFRAA